MPMEARKQWTEIPLETRTLIMEGKAKSNQIRKVNLAGIETTNIDDSGEDYDKEGEDKQETPELQVNKTLAGETPAGKTHAGDPRRVLADKKTSQPKKSLANHVRIANNTCMTQTWFPPSNPTTPPLAKAPPHPSEGGIKQITKKEEEASRSMFYIETEQEPGPMYRIVDEDEWMSDSSEDSEEWMSQGQTDQDFHMGG
jgi:hypothetical protein